MNEIIDLSRSYSKIVFHCHFSASRGPKSASLFNREFSKTCTEERELEIYILRGGFERWYEEYKDDPSLYTEL